MKNIQAADTLAKACSIISWPDLDSWLDAHEYQFTFENAGIYAENKKIYNKLSYCFSDKQIRELFDLAHEEGI